MDILFFGSYTRFSQIKWTCIELKKRLLLPLPLPHPPTEWTNWQINEFHVSKLNWRHFFLCHYIHLYSTSIIPAHKVTITPPFFTLNIKYLEVKTISFKLGQIRLNIILCYKNLRNLWLRKGGKLAGISWSEGERWLAGERRGLALVSQLQIEGVSFTFVQLISKIYCSWFSI